jgi:hypothetical protein
MKHPKQNFVASAASVALTLLFSVAGTGCAKYEITLSAAKDALPQEERPVICDPFANGSMDAKYGLEGEIHYLAASQPRYETVKDFEEQGHKVNADLFLSQLNVPTRAFTAGFTTQNGSTVKDEAGTMLQEWFSIHMKTSLVLSDQDTAGDYQLAAISDDGMVMSTNPATGASQTIINNDGLTPSRMGCATAPLHFEKDTQLPVKIGYFQGPKYHIALVLMWRKLPSNPADRVDPSCGIDGNYAYFNSDVSPSSPQQAYKDLLTRGWKPLTASNFLLAPGSTNRCATL